MNYYWAKLRFSYLDDPKLGSMKDWVFRRYFLCYMVAGETGNDGLLPSVSELAWRIRDDESRLRDALRAMSKAGLAFETDPDAEVWTLTRFAEEQGAVSDAERKAAQRARDKDTSRSGHEDVTERDTEEDIDKEKDKEKESSTAAREREQAVSGVFQSYSENIGPITSKVADAINDYLDDGVSHEWIIETFEIAAEQNKRSWAYSKAILDRWIRDGKDNGRREKQTKQKTKGVMKKSAIDAVLESAI